NRIGRAIELFNRAIAIDGALGNAWLGRGLCRIRRGDIDGGRADLQVAATLEPQRAVLRSYLGKAFSNTSDNTRAANELRLAKELDPKDPTPWLYSGLLNQQENRLNKAVRDLQQSEELNDNRRLYRSTLLLDQDRAVRGVNLAIVYDDAGLIDVATREAARAIAADPANFSAHLFLANTYQRQRDPNGILQRFETPAINEYLLAALLAPVGAGTLAQSVSQQEYSKLFESDGFGVASSTEYLSRGAWTESAAQYGTFGNSSYAVSAFHRTDPGQRPNNDILQTELSLQLKQQISAKDSIYVRTIYGETKTGDVIPRYDPNSANTGLRTRENQEPLLLAGYHHEWQPGIHTLVLGGWFKDDARVSDPQERVLVLVGDPSGSRPITDVLRPTAEEQYRNRAELFTAEAQQLWQTAHHTLTLGGRYQGGNLHTENEQTVDLNIISPLFSQDTKTDFERISVYGYYHWHPIDELLLVGGVSYDQLRFPQNFRFAPVSADERRDNQVSPKGGIVWTPARHTTLRFGYSQSLGGVGFDQSFRLEPSQVAGFNQSFRSLIPESIAGANVDAPFETWGASFEQQLGSSTFLGISAELLNSKVDRVVGVYDSDPSAPSLITPTSTRENLDYRERSLLVTFNQLLGDEWSVGARYRLSQARLRDNFADVPDSAATGGDFRARSEVESVLHQVNLFAIYNHPSGFFAQGESVWYAQSNRGYVQDRPGDDFWQFNAFAGYRFLQRRVEARIGVLNIADHDYRLNPLNITPDLPRARTFVASLKFNF
ncbi:MAG TPA: TonB-dependent receptor, partial [Verrucomicrobiae bacterium]|nr:TonB-dependent receptor [Verrucomicrobiae bacterium]